MYYCKEFSSLAVLSLYEGDYIGVVNKLLFDKKLKKMCGIELTGEDGIKLFLPAKDIYNIGKNAITIKNNNAVTLKESFENFLTAPMNSKAYTIKGEYVGLVQDIILNEKFSTEKIVLNSDIMLNIDDLATCGKNTLIFYGDAEKKDLKKFAPKQPKALKKRSEQVVENLPFETEEKNNSKEVVKAPINLDLTFLVGRICTKDIFNFNNELLIKANSVINKSSLKMIDKFGKLRELMLYSK